MTLSIPALQMAVAVIEQIEIVVDGKHVVALRERVEMVKTQTSKEIGCEFQKMTQ
jgi:hypothetical protein